MGKKRPTAQGAAIGWLFALSIVAFVGWCFWRGKKTESNPATQTASTNLVDVSRATNLLHWLNTNFVAPPPNLASTNVVVPPPSTNRPRTNVALPRPVPFLKPVTNLTTVVTNRVPQTNLFTPAPAAQAAAERTVRNMAEAQVALARQGISCGPIDGVAGLQTRAALRAFQLENEIPPSGDLDAATSEVLTIAEPVFTNYVVTPDDLARVRPLPETWMAKSEAEALDFETILELVAERHQASHMFIKALNPKIAWMNITPFTSVKVPSVPRAVVKRRAAFIHIALAAKTLEAFDAETNLLAHFPCSIAARVEKRPVGQLTVVTGAENPNYTFDPAVFPESEEARQIDHKLIIPPGPNNPVGTAWISLDRPGYGIHGTPRPEQVGRTESHGCFRLANWNAEYLLKLVSPGVPVYVDP